TLDSRAGLRVGAKVLENGAHRVVMVGAAVIGRRPRPGGSQNAGLSQVVRVHELVEVVAAAEHGHVVAGADPLEEDLEDTQAPVPHDGSWANYGNVQTTFDIPAAELLAFQFSAPVRFGWGGHGLFGDRVYLGGSKNRARGDVDDFLDMGRKR